MIPNGKIVVKELPDGRIKRKRREFLAEVKQLGKDSYRPQLIIDLPSHKLTPETLDLLLSCAEQIEKAEGRLSVAGASPEATVILELTRLTSVIKVFPSLSQAMGIDTTYSRSEGVSDDRNLAA